MDPRFSQALAFVILSFVRMCVVVLCAVSMLLLLLLRQRGDCGERGVYAV